MARSYTIFDAAEAQMRDVLLESLNGQEHCSGPATGTPFNLPGLSVTEKLMLRAWQRLVAGGLVTETPSHFRSAGYYHSYYRLREDAL